MKKRTIRILSFVIVLCILISFPSYAHSGRTDSNGGHRDNKNKSGLGYYHYHHGYGPHLHSNGVCPYKDVSLNISSSVSATSSEAKQNIVEKKPQVVATDIKTFINENEIPTFYYNGEQGGTVVIVEDLVRYGFDKVWNEETKTVTLTRNIEKEVTPMEMEYYHNLKQGQVLYDIFDSDIKVVLKTSVDSEEIQATKIYNLNGYVAISTSEFTYFGSVSWDNASRKVTVTLNNN